MAHTTSIFKKWLEDTLNAEPEYPYTNQIKISSDIKVQVHKQLGYDPEVHLLAKDSLSIAYGDYVCDLSGRTSDEIESVVEAFYEDAKLHGIDAAIQINQSLWR